MSEFRGLSKEQGCVTVLSPETCRFIEEHGNDDVRVLALQAGKYPGVDMAVAIAQIAGRQMAREKIPSWGQLAGIRYPGHLPLEQCSSEATARYKARLLSGGSLVDLTGGFGIDCAFLAPGFRSVTYVERLPELCSIAAHNFSLLGLNHIAVRNGDGVEYLRSMRPVDCIYIDPARRNRQGGKTVAIADCEPDVAALEGLLLEKAERVMVKLSPMLDLSQAMSELPQVQEAHIVSVHNECKELLLLLGRERQQAVPLHAVNLTTDGVQDFTFTREQEQQSPCLYASEPGTYLYEPNVSLLKAGAFRTLAAVYALQKLHPNSHLYTSDVLVNGFPGRTFRVLFTCGFGKRELKEALSGLKQANLAVRNFPASVAELRKRTKLADGGDTYLFATTLADGRKCLIGGKKVEKCGLQKETINELTIER